MEKSAEEKAKTTEGEANWQFANFSYKLKILRLRGDHGTVSHPAYARASGISKFTELVATLLIEFAVDSFFFPTVSSQTNVTAKKQ